MEADAGLRIDALRAYGGMVGNELLMQFQADLLDRTVMRPAMRETTALGAAYAAGLSCGVYAGPGELTAPPGVDGVGEKSWVPAMEETRRAHMVRQWRKAVERSFGWAEE